MASENKKKKEKNCYPYHGFALKEKLSILKKIIIF